MFALVPKWDYHQNMRIVAKKPLVEYWTTHPDTEEPLKAWYASTLKAKWSTPQDIKAEYSSASFLPRNRVVFNIKGNSHRLVVAVAYKMGAVYIKFLGTHTEYDKIDASTI
jgi:mRNA interferase HigB